MLENEVDKQLQTVSPSTGGNPAAGSLALGFGGGASLLEGRKEIVCPLCHSKQSLSAIPSGGANTTAGSQAPRYK